MDTTQEHTGRARETYAATYYKRLILKSDPTLVAWVKTAIEQAMRPDGRVDWGKIAGLQNGDPAVKDTPPLRIRRLGYALLNRRRSGYNKPHKCKLCARRFLSRLALAMHASRTHKTVLSTPRARGGTAAVGNSSRSKPKAGVGNGWGFCPYCGGGLDVHGANFCHRCGHELR